MSIQNPDLSEEIEAITAIYDPDTLTVTSTTPDTTTTTLQIPSHPHLSFVLSFDPTYPDTRPKILGTASTASRGEGKLAIDVLEDILARVYQPGAVCLFDLINEAVDAFGELNIGGQAQTETTGTSTHDDKHNHNHNDDEKEPQLRPEDIASLSLRDTFGIENPPEWILSEVVTEKKSVFVARAAHVTSLEQAQGYLDYLLATEKKVAAATHNISAWRIRQVKKTGAGAGGGGKGDGKGETTEMIVQDFDDDGETAAGGRLLHLMQLMDVWDVVVVVTRWYGGIHLGPDRFRIINAVGRDALLRGGFGKEAAGRSGEGKGKKKGKK